VDYLAEVRRLWGPDTVLAVMLEGDRSVLKLLTHPWIRLPGPVRILSIFGFAAEHRISRIAKRVLFPTLALHPQASLVRIAMAARTGTVPGRGQIVDPIDLAADYDEASIRESFSLSPDRYWFAVLGDVSDRKNVPLIIEALLRSTPHQNLGLLVAGRLEMHIEAGLRERTSELSAHGVQVTIAPRILSDVELDGLIRTVDCLLLTHSNDGPSAMFGKAAAAGTHVVAAGSRSLRRAVAAFSLGVWSPLDADGIAAAMRQVRTLKRPQPQAMSDGQHFARELLGTSLRRGDHDRSGSLSQPEES
jgi:hypothetical protein